MDIVTITHDNLDKEHVCCAISEKKGECLIESKKNWMRNEIENGLTFKKFDVRGKVFIEYIPGENAWYPFEADGYMIINCFWVSGKYKGQGNGKVLLEECIKDSKKRGMKGIAALAGKKKIPFLNDGKYLKSKGFKVCDTADPFFELLYLPFDERTEDPKIKECAKKAEIKDKGLKIFYTNQCPFTEKYINEVKQRADEKNIDLKIQKFESREQAQSSPSACTTYAVFYNGKFITNEILNEKKFDKICEQFGVK